MGLKSRKFWLKKWVTVDAPLISWGDTFIFKMTKKYQADVTFSKQAWFSYVRKIRDDQEFYCFPTIPHFMTKLMKPKS